MKVVNNERGRVLTCQNGVHVNHYLWAEKISHFQFPVMVVEIRIEETNASNNHESERTFLNLGNRYSFNKGLYNP